MSTTTDGMPYSDSAIHDAPHDDDTLHDDEPSPFDNAQFFGPFDTPPDSKFDDFLSADEPTVDERAARMVEPKPRGRKAEQYERKVQGLFAVGIKVTIAHPRTLADSAAMLAYGPNIAEKAGDLAAANPKAAAIIDMITDQTESPAAALLVASIPFALQVIRNHEPEVVKESTRGIPIGRGRKLRLRFPFKLGKRMRNFTRDPADLTAMMFSQQEIIDALAKQGIEINVVG